MNKATIISDAITYIEELKRSVEELSNQLLQMETTNYVDQEKIKSETRDEEQEMKKMGIIIVINYNMFHLFQMNCSNQNLESC